MLNPEILIIQITSQIAITAPTMYRIHWQRVFGSVRFGISLLYIPAMIEAWA